MAQLSSFFGRLIYLDTNVIIYAVEGFPKLKTHLDRLFAAVDDRKLQIVTSELTLAEVLVKPISDGNTTVQQAYKSFLEPSDQFQIVPIDRRILETAAIERATTGIKLPDAIHLATAKECGCQAFLSNDKLAPIRSDLVISRIEDL